MATYSFTIEFDKYHRTTTLQDVKSISVSGICILAKNSKVDGFYKSDYILKTIGKFSRCAGSWSSPILFPEKESVKINVIGFPRFPILDRRHKDHDRYLNGESPTMDEIFIQPHLRIKNIIINH